MTENISFWFSPVKFKTDQLPKQNLNMAVVLFF